MAVKTLVKGTGIAVLSLGFLAGCSDEGSIAGEDGEYYTEDALNTWAEEEGFVKKEELNTWAEEEGYVHEEDLNTWAEENGLME